VVQLQVRQQEYQATHELSIVRGRNLIIGNGSEVAGRQAATGGLVIVTRETNLLEVVGAGHAVGGFAHLLHGGQEQADQDGDDGDDHEQLDEGEGSTWACHGCSNREVSDNGPAARAPLPESTWESFTAVRAE